MKPAMEASNEVSNDGNIKTTTTSRAELRQGDSYVNENSMLYDDV